MMTAQRRILNEGFDLSEKALFDAAHRAMLNLDERAFYYRLILDLVDGVPSRAPIEPGTESPTRRRIVFPEPHRATHVDAKGFRRRGDYYTLRSQFEYPAVPMAGFYRVQLLGVFVLGTPVVYNTHMQGGSELYVELPASPFHAREWKASRWGSPEEPIHRLRQQARRGEDPQEKLKRIFERGEAASQRQARQQASPGNIYPAGPPRAEEDEQANLARMLAIGGEHVSGDPNQASSIEVGTADLSEEKLAELLAIAGEKI